MDVSLEEVGKVLTVGDGIARIYGLNNAQSGELVEFETGEQGIVQNLEEDNVGVVMLAESNTINEGDTVKRTKRIASVKGGEQLVGRVINTIGEPIDGNMYDATLSRQVAQLRKEFSKNVYESKL